MLALKFHRRNGRHHIGNLIIIGPVFRSDEAAVTQLGECKTEDLEVAGSSPACGTYAFLILPGKCLIAEQVIAREA